MRVEGRAKAGWRGCRYEGVRGGGGAGRRKVAWLGMLSEEDV